MASVDVGCRPVDSAAEGRSHLANGLKVRFWGVRGSISCSGAEYTRYGGNTSCLEVTAGGRRLIFDAGTGIRPLGLELARQTPIDIDIYFTHTHLDHITGLTFFSPLFEKRNSVRLWAGHLQAPHTLKKVVSNLMQAPLYPVSLEVFLARVEFNEFKSGDELSCGDMTMRTAPLNHPQGATGYRVEYGGKSICYITDTEHEPGKPDQNILGLIEGADLFIYDATYTETEYPNHKGWGHSTWEEGAKLADLAKVKRFVIFHHDPSHDDVFMDRVAAAAEARRSGTIVAREGTTLEP